MRYLMILIFIVLQGCSNSSCDMLDLSIFDAPEPMLQCDAAQLSEDEMDECVKQRHAKLYRLDEQYGIGFDNFLRRFDTHRHLADEAFIANYGTYILGTAFTIADASDLNMIAAIRFLLAEGVDPFQPFETQSAPVGWLLPGYAIIKSTPDTLALWALVKEYYPPEAHELSQQVDLYLRYCKQK